MGEQVGAFLTEPVGWRVGCHRTVRGWLAFKVIECFLQSRVTPTCRVALFPEGSQEACRSKKMEMGTFLCPHVPEMLCCGDGSTGENFPALLSPTSPELEPLGPDSNTGLGQESFSGSGSRFFKCSPPWLKARHLLPGRTAQRKRKLDI